MLTKLVIIDNRVEDYQTVINALRTDVGFIILEYDIDTYETLKNKIDALELHQPIESVALLSHGDFSENYKMLENASPSIFHDVEELDPELESWNEYIEFFKSLGTPIIDLLGCAIYMDENWRYVLNKLETKMSVDFRASIDNTGSLATGANWILESDNANIKDIYFNEDIDDWLGTLGSGIGNFSAVIDSSGRVYTCGSNSFGQLGLGSSYTSVNIFTLVSSISNENIIQISTGERHMACVTDSGKLYTWGRNTDGQLGIGSSGSATNQYLPQYMSYLSNRKIISVACGRVMTICLDSSGYVYSTGNSSNIARNISLVPANKFGQITDLSNNIIVQISTGSLHTGFLTINGRVYTSGTQSSGVLGNGQTGSTLTSIYLTDISNAYKIVCGYNNTGYIKNDGLLYTFGYNSSYLIFPNSNATVTTTTRLYYNAVGVSTPSIYNSNINDLIFGNQHTYVFKGNAVYITGANPNGYTGFGSNYTLDISRVPRELDISAINIYCKQSVATIQINTLILDTNYNLHVVGYNWYGDLGTGNNTDISNRTIISPTTFNPPTNRVELLPDTFKKQYGVLVYQTVADNSTTINRVGIYPNNLNYTYEISSIKRDGILINNFTDISINSSTGTITRIGSISYGNHEIEVKATSTNGTVTGTAFLNMTTNPPSNLIYNQSTLRINFGDISSSVTPSINLGEATSVTYSLDSNITGISINSTTGVITCNNTILNSGTYNLIVIATSFNNVGSAITYFAIIVDPLPPSLFSYTPASITFKYGDISDSSIPSINTGGSPSMLYEISGGNIGSIITINQTTGVISVNNPTTITSYTLVIKASNSKGTVITPVNITITTAPPSAFSYTPNIMNIRYGDSSNSIIPVINSGGEPSISYEISGGSPHPSISINIETGVISVINGNTSSTYNLIIKATNPRGTAIASYRISFTNVAPYNFSYTPNTMNLVYGDVSSSVIPNINKGSNNSIRYDISGGNIGSIITINTFTGVISINNPSTTADYNLIITALTVVSFGITTTPFNIYVRPTPPSGLTYSLNTMTLNKGDVSNSVVPTINFGSNVIYEISGGNIDDVVTIDEFTGIISVNSPLNPITYNLVIKATNENGTAIGYYNVIVNPDPPSGFSYSPSSMVINYGDISNSIVPNINTGGAQYISYEISGGNIGSTITINSSTGIITVTNPLTIRTYSLIIKASNNSGTVTTSYNIDVRSIAPSAFSYTPTSMTLKYGDISKSVVPTINKGGETDILYEISGGNIGSIVTINSSTGIITVANPTTVGTYSLLIKASNTKGTTVTPYSINVSPNKPVGFRYDPSSVTINYGQSVSSIAKYDNSSGNVNFNYSFVSDKIYYPNGISINNDGTINTTTDLCSNTYKLTVSSNSIGGDISTNLIIKVNTSDISYSNISASDIRYKESFNATVITGNFYNPYNNKPVDVTYTLFHNIANQIGTFPITAFINGGDNYKIGGQITANVNVIPLEPSGYRYEPLSYIQNRDGSQNAIINDTGDQIYYTIIGISKDSIEFVNNNVFTISNIGRISWTDQLSEGHYDIFTDASNSQGRKQAKFTLAIIDQIIPITKYTYNSLPSILDYGQGYTSGLPDISGTVDSFNLTVSSNISNPSQYISINTYGIIIVSPNIPVGTYNITANVINNISSSQVQKTISVNSVKPYAFSYDPSFAILDYKQSYISSLPQINFGGENSVVYAIRESITGIDISKTGGLINIDSNTPVGKYVLDVDVSNSKGITTIPYPVTIRPLPIDSFNYNSVSITIDVSGNSNIPIINETGENIIFSINNIRRNGVVYTTDRISVDTSGQIRWTDDISSGSYIINIDASNSLYKTSSSMNLNVSSTISNLSYSNFKSDISYGFNGTFYATYSGYIKNFSINVTKQNSNGQYEPYNNNNIVIDATYGNIIFSEGIPVGTYKLSITASNKENSFIVNPTIRVRMTPPSNFKYDISNMVIGFGDISSSILPTVNNGGDDMVYYGTNDSRIIVDSITGIITTKNNILAGVHVVTVDASNSIGKTSTNYKITVTKKLPSGLRYDPSYVEIFQGETINMSPILLNSGGNTSINYMYSSNGYGTNPNIIISNGIISTTPILPIGTYNLIVTLMSEVGNITTNAVIKVKKPSDNPVNAVINYNESVKEILYDGYGISLRPTIVGDISGLYVSNYSISNISNLIVNKVFIDNSGVLEFGEYIPLGQYNITVKATFNDQRFITTIYTLRVKSRPIDLYLPHIYDIYGTVTRNESISVADITQDYFIEEYDDNNNILSLSTLKPLLKMRDNININNIQIGDLPSVTNTSDTKNQIKSLLIRPSFKTSNNTSERLTLKEHYKRNVSTSILGSKDIQFPTIIRNELEKDISNFDIGEIFVGANGLNDLVVRQFLLKQLQDNRPERFSNGASAIGQLIDFPIQEGDSIIIRIKTESNIVKDSTIFDRSSIRRLLQHLSNINNINNFSVDNTNKVVKIQPKIWSIKLKLGL